MPECNNWDKKFWKSAFSESDGTGSASRVLSGIVVVFALSWVTLVIVHNMMASGHVIMSMPELGSTAVFVSSVVGVLYGINKVSSKVSDATININKKAE